MNKLTINQLMQLGETSKIKKYSDMVDLLIQTAKNENVDTVELSSEFTPMLLFTDIKRNQSLLPITGDYLYGIKDNINFIIKANFLRMGKIGSIDIELV